MIGADGKVGVVRKYFLEPSAGIRQEEGVYRYSGTWVAANLKIRLPTQQSHPDLPLWALGYTPEQIYDLFWPKNWHFCSPPGKPTASGRFGPHEERLWRHEFRQEDWNDKMDAIELLWEHLSPLITRDRDEKGILFLQRVQFPLDCIDIVRCRPFSFVHKVVNKWFAERTILIGDAAHVFPPFAGQGIASGVRDAYQLAWRLAVLLKDSHISENASTSFLQAWALERRKSVNDAALLSMMNGKLCNKQPTLWILVLMRLIGMLSHIPCLHRAFDSQAKMNLEGFTAVEKGFFLKRYNGGIPLAQIVVQSNRQGSMLSDQMFRSKVGLLSLLVITQGDHAKAYSEAKAAIEAASISSAVISTDSIVLFSPSPGIMPLKGSYGTIEDGPEIFWHSEDRQMLPSICSSYTSGSFIDRIGKSTRFALVRPDKYVYSRAKDVGELTECLSMFQAQLYGE